MEAVKKMKNELEMAISSRRILTELVARDQITALIDFGGGLMRPDRCGEFEPIRTAFDPADISEPTRWLAEAQGRFLYRKGRPAHVAGEMWNRTLHQLPAFHRRCSATTGRADSTANGRSELGSKRLKILCRKCFERRNPTLLC